MDKKPKLLYLLRKSDTNTDIMPVLKRDDFPLQFYFKGNQISIEITKNGKIELKKQRLTGTNGA